jgi:hypothetical protein
MNHRHCVRFFLVILFFMLVGCEEKFVQMKEAGQARGKTLVVDDSGDAGQYVSMDVGPNDLARLVYYDKKNQKLKFAEQKDSGVALETVDDTCNQCLFANIELDAKGESHVAYYSDTTQMVTYAYKKEGVWKHESIEWGKGSGMGLRFLFDGKQQLHALYYSGDGFLKHAWRVLAKDAKSVENRVAERARGKGGPEEPPEGIWGTEQVDKANGSEQVLISFIRKPRGGFAASYLHWSGLSSELRLATQEGEQGDWSVDVVARENNPGKSSALVFTDAQEPMVLFREALKDRLMLTRFSEKGWSAIPLLPRAYNMAVESDSHGNLLLAYEKVPGNDPRKGILQMAIRKEGMWLHYVVDGKPGSGSHIDVAWTSTQQPRVAYYEESKHTLKLFLGD